AEQAERDRVAAEQAAQQAAEQAAREEAQRAEQAAREQADGAETTRQATDRYEQDALLASQASSLLTALNRDVPEPRAPVEPEPVEEVHAAEPEAVAEQLVAAAPPPLVSRDQTDTAMLLRELSSLGFAEEDERPSTPPPSPRPSPPAGGVDKNKKRKGLFGRG
ncbi:MAG: hypothetical protein ACRDV1_04780, partial [Actinomycetes bacterium]